MKHEIAKLNLVEEIEPSLAQFFKLCFEWSNKMGMKGIKLSNLEFFPTKNNDPLNQLTFVICDMKEETSEKTCTSKSLPESFASDERSY